MGPQLTNLLSKKKCQKMSGIEIFQKIPTLTLPKILETNSGLEASFSMAILRDGFDFGGERLVRKWVKKYLRNYLKNVFEKMRSDPSFLVISLAMKLRRDS